MLLTSIFYFSHNVFKSHIQVIKTQYWLFGKEFKVLK